MPWPEAELSRTRIGMLGGGGGLQAGGHFPGVRGVHAAVGFPGEEEDGGILACRP